MTTHHSDELLVQLLVKPLTLSVATSNLEIYTCDALVNAQVPIRQTADEQSTVLKDLCSWENEMRLVENKYCSTTPKYLTVIRLLFLAILL
jgi:hypothetical protein